MSHIEERPSGCWEWARGAAHRFGYGSLRIGNKTWAAHRLSFHLFNGDIPPGSYVLHSCDNPKCANPDHLRAGTQRDNMHDAISRGRRASQRGELSARAKLSEKDVADIRRRRANGETGTALAKEYGVHHMTIYSAESGKSWGHI